MNTENFILKATEVWGNKFDYSETIYERNDKKVKIKYNSKEFYQTPKHHLEGHLPLLLSDKHSSYEDFVKKAISVHGNKYNYSKVDYINRHTKVCIICPEHGEFYQTPTNHLNGNACPKCRIEKISNSERSTVKEFIEKARKIHGDKYDYSKVEYINNYTKVCITCPKHGEFWQTPNNHLRGCGCPKCNMSHLEHDIIQFLDRHGIEYEYQKRFKWLGKMSLDFYLPKYNIAIECQGRQHYESVDYFGGKDEYKKQQERDKRKYELCEKHNIRLRYYKRKR